MGFFEPVGDARDLLFQGVEAWQLALFGLITLPVGFLFWHGLGPDFGLGKEGKVIKTSHALAQILLLLVVVIGELIWCH